MRDAQQALLTGFVAGGLMRAGAEVTPIEVNLPADADGNYLPIVQATIGGNRYVITVVPEYTIAELPEEDSPSG